jgi:hypothetical protein
MRFPVGVTHYDNFSGEFLGGMAQSALGLNEEQAYGK